MRDEQIKELVSAYLDDELSVDERALVERHLADSVECQQFLDQLRQQRLALRSLPRHKLKSDFSQRVLRAIEQVRPAVSPAVVPAAASPQDRVAIRLRWKTWQGAVMAIGTVAALVMLALYLSQPNRNGVVPHIRDIVDDKPVGAGQTRPEDVKPPEESGPKTTVPEEPLSPEALLALGEFQKLVQYVMVYDITLTPRAQKSKLFEGWMEKAGIPISKGILINQKLEKEILAARFVEDAKIAPALKGKLPEDDVQMLFVRGAAKHIDAIGWNYFNSGMREEPNPELHMKMDLVFAPRDLHIFLQLNEATGLDIAEMNAKPATLKAPNAFPMQFQQPLHTVAFARHEFQVPITAVSISDSQVNSIKRRVRADFGDELALAQVDTGAVVVQAPNAPTAKNALTGKEEVAAPIAWGNPEDPSQAIFIIRRLKDEPKQDANN